MSKNTTTQFAWLAADAVIISAGIWSSSAIWKVLATIMLILVIASVAVAGVLIRELDRKP